VSDQVVSRTDPDAASMNAGGRVTLGYQDHYVIDGGKHRILLHALALPADVMENQPMLDLLWRVRFRWQLRTKRAVGDTTYGTIENIRALEDAGIRAYVPLPNWDRTPFYGPSRFTYVPEEDAYRCPAGAPLRPRRADPVREVIQYRADAATCNACPAKSACTPSTKGRQVTLSFYADYLDRVRAYHQTEGYKKAMRKRAVWVEPLFGEAKQWHNLKKFRLRGLRKVNTEALLVAAGQNLKRYLAATGWGRRHAPSGALQLPQQLPQWPATQPHTHGPTCAVWPRRRPRGQCSRGCAATLSTRCVDTGARDARALAGSGDRARDGPRSPLPESSRTANRRQLRDVPGAGRGARETRSGRPGGGGRARPRCRHRR